MGTLKSNKLKKRLRGKKYLPKSLTVNIILDHLDSDELKEFVLSYARKNPAFVHRLKSKYARKIELVDNRVKYKYILDSVVGPRRRPEDKLYVRAIKEFKTISMDLLDQSEDCISLLQFTEAKVILTSVIYKTEYIVHAYHSDHKYFKEIRARCILILKTLIQQSIAPELVLEIHHFLTELSQASFYRFTAINGYYLLYAALPLGRNDLRDGLLDMLVLIANEQRDSREIIIVLSLISILSLDCRFASKFLTSRSDIDKSIIYVNSLMQHGYHLLAQKAAKILLSHFGTSDHLKDTMMQASAAIGDENNHQKMATNLLMNTSQYRYYLELEPYLSKKERIDLLLNIAAKKKDKPLLISKVVVELINLNARNEALHIFRQELKIDNLTDFIEVVNYLSEQEFNTTYIAVVDSYLSSHVGIMASHKVNHYRHELDMQCDHKYVRLLDKLIIEKYPERRIESFFK